MQSDLNSYCFSLDGTSYVGYPTSIMQIFSLNIRPKRQIILPNELLEQLGVNTGDSLEAKVVDNQLVMLPKKRIALDAFSELQKIIQKSSFVEPDIQSAIKEQRAK
jgi:antitoxin component of MazEF toxin-antitoxin module